ncbi:FadR/GntR family transcriptional regulator [Leucobacter insecticola]|uniref:FadR/GntR family transcriptional regulator n=1 Tax=Leucobacter insecticola TaxID=2714934 RepID=UPI003138468A
MPAAALAASRRSDADLEELAAILNSMAEITAGTSQRGARAWVEQDAMFHSAIARASRNGVFESFIAEIREALERQSQLLATAAKRQEQSDREHREIFDAIAAGDAEAALHAMSLHLHAVADAVNSLTQAHLTDIRDAEGAAN